MHLSHLLLHRVRRASSINNAALLSPAVHTPQRHIRHTRCDQAAGRNEMDGASTRSSAGRLSHGDGGTETALPKLQLLPWLHEAVVKVVAADDDRDYLAGSATAAKAGKRRSTAQAGLARGVKVLLSEVAEMIRTKFERSIPAAKFGHVAYIR